MALSLIALTNTFNEWRVNHNQIVTIVNNLTEGVVNVTSVININTSGGLAGDGVSLNVQNGRIATVNLTSNNVVTRYETITGDLLILGNVTVQGSGSLTMI